MRRGWWRPTAFFFALQCSGAAAAPTWPPAAETPTPSPSLKALAEPASDADSFHTPSAGNGLSKVDGEFGVFRRRAEVANLYNYSFLAGRQLAGRQLTEYLESAESCYDPSGQDCSCTSISIGDSCDCGGTVPSELSACTSLTKTALNTGAMTGTIPPELSTLTSLTELNFGNNRGMTGSFPAELSTLTSLQKIFMDKNSFTGAIPSEWSTLNSLTNLCVS